MVQISQNTTFHFDSDIADMMGSAFDATWNILATTGSVYAQPDKCNETRERIALKLIELVNDGELEADRLVIRALADLRLLPDDQSAEVTLPPTSNAGSPMAFPEP